MKELIRRSIKYIVVILAICVGLSTLAYFAFNAEGNSFERVATNWSFMVVLMLFCYALMAFVTEQGLFNGIRFSTKHVRATLSKTHRYLMMEENSLKSEEQLKQLIKEKYLYTRPKFHSTYPLLISSTLLFAIVSTVSFIVF